MKDAMKILNADEKAVLLKTLKEMYQANGQMYEWVHKEVLTEEMSNMLLTLIESCFSNTAKMLDYESYLMAEKEKRHEEIRKANQKIRELEEKLGSERKVDGLKEQLEYLRNKVRDWWKIEGFNHISEERFTPYGGLRLEFCFMLEHRRTSRDTPITDKRNREEHIQYLRNMGFDFADFETSRSEQLNLIDNKNNRILLTKMLRERFPSLEIHTWDNISSYSKQDEFVIRHIDATIYDLADI